MKQILLAGGIFLLICCGETVEQASTKSDDKDSTVVQSPVEKISLARDSVRAEPVQQYSEKTDDPLNDWYFSVTLYETSQTFHYLVKLQFEEVRGEDTLRLPNFGILPRPVLKKGPDKYSCIIGFLDKDNNFREYKKVYVKDDALKIITLKHYGVSVK